MKYIDSSVILRIAAEPLSVLLNTLDAVHLATAMLRCEDKNVIGFATHDRALAAAARAVGFPVIGV